MGKMHQNEFEIDENLVRALLKTACPHLADLSLKAIPSSGTDHALFRLGNEYVVRMPRIEWAVESINKEYKWVPKIAPYLKTAIAEPIFKGNASHLYPWPWLVIKWNEGHNPHFENENEYELLAKDLAYFLNELHGINLINGPFSRRGIPLKEQDKETKKALAELAGEIDIKSLSQLWDNLISVPVWSDNPVWIHGDFLPGNILVKNNHLSAALDFSDIGMGDPACDLIIAWSLFNGHSRSIFRAHLDHIDDDTWERGRGWALSIALIILPYYKHSNPYLVALAKRMIENVLQTSANKT